MLTPRQDDVLRKLVHGWTLREMDGIWLTGIFARIPVNASTFRSLRARQWVAQDTKDTTLYWITALGRKAAR